MQMVIPGQANTVTHDLVNSSTGAAIESGTVTFYLRALNGTNAGKWFRASDSTWQETEVSAGAGTFVAYAQWECEIVGYAWESGVLYSKYAKESGALEIPYSEQIVPSVVVGVVGTGQTRVPYSLTDETTGDPIPDATVWVSTDDAGENLVGKGTTDTNGQVVFYLAAGTYYFWRQKAGYSFENPDTEVVT